jgi:hypothetical protein
MLHVVPIRIINKQIMSIAHHDSHRRGLSIMSETSQPYRDDGPVGSLIKDSDMKAAEQTVLGEKIHWVTFGHLAVIYKHRYLSYPINMNHMSGFKGTA